MSKNERPALSRHGRSRVRSRVEAVRALAIFFDIADARLTNRCAIGGGDRDRTDDLLLAKQALSQLSYTPEEVVSSQLSAQSFRLELHSAPGRSRCLLRKHLTRHALSATPKERWW